MKNLQLEAVAPYNTFNEVELLYKQKVNTQERKSLKSSKDVFELLNTCYDYDKIEHKEFFYVMYTNKRNAMLSVMKLSEGGIAGTVVDVKHIIQGALLLNASGIILSHNHPSGNIKPSDADITITKRIKQAALLFEINVLDHIIVCPGNNYYSFADEGII